MARVKSWWRLKKIRHRDAVILASLSSACLLAGELIDQDITNVYRTFLLPVAADPALFLWDTVLAVMAFLTYFGGILVLMGGANFLWGKVGRGRNLLGLGIGISAIGLLRYAALYTLLFGSPVVYFSSFIASLSGIGILLGLASYILMHEYALMLKKHARSMWRQWRRSRRPRPTRRRSRSSAAGRN